MKIVINDFDADFLIRTLREWTELTQEEFGKRIHYSRKAIQSYELGVRKWTVETLINICNEYDFKITIESKKDINLKTEKHILEYKKEKAKDKIGS